MKIKGPKNLVKLAKFCADCLDISNFHLNIQYIKDDTSMCEINEDGSFDITIQGDLIDEEQTLKHVGHEMVHLRQFKHDELRQLNDTQVIWRDEVYTMYNPDEEEYFLSPWEMEARALEEWFVFRWENK